jgi:MFS family permease
MFIGCRFLIGFGNAWACIAAPVLITEIAFPTHRAPLTSLYNATWYLGSIIAAWTTFGTFRIESTWAWRIPSALQGIPPVIQGALILFFPESPRWLVDHGRDEEAMRIISKYHCGGNMDDPLLAFEYEEIKEALRMEKEAKNTSSYKAMFTTKGNLKRMRVIVAIAFFSQWSGNGVVSYYLSLVLKGIGITTEFEQNLFNGILQIYNLGTAYLGALVVDRAGRRTLFLTSTAGMCITFAIWTACSATYDNSRVLDAQGETISANKNAGNAVAAMIFIYYGVSLADSDPLVSRVDLKQFYNIALSPLLVSYTVEM